MGPDDESVSRFERYEAALEELASEGDKDASSMLGSNAIRAMKRAAFINAAINGDPKVLRKIARVIHHPGAETGINFVALAERVKVRVVIMRLG